MAATNESHLGSTRPHNKVLTSLRSSPETRSPVLKSLVRDPTVRLFSLPPLPPGPGLAVTTGGSDRGVEESLEPVGTAGGVDDPSVVGPT